MPRAYIGIDVGTLGVRAGVFDASGTKLGRARRDIRTWRPRSNFVEQSSEDIWEAVCAAVRKAMSQAGVAAEDIGGIGFDSTCSLVVLDEKGRPVSISPTENDEQNVIVWMDHRAIRQAGRINETGHRVLDYVGGTISPEMETPKLLWIKENLPRTWERAAYFFDLPDFLTFRATGADVRSLCSTVCKWTFLGHEDCWDESFFRLIGLKDLVDEGFKRIGTTVHTMGDSIASGLTASAARELGLNEGTAVGVSIINAHAGGIGVLGVALDGQPPSPADLESRLALIGGPSSCHMAVSREARFVPGVWGPYYSALIPGMWLSEGGESATGALIDHVINSHVRVADLKAKSEALGRGLYETLNAHLDHLAGGHSFAAELTRELHVLPYFHGNRSPRADPTLKGMVSGLRLSDGLDDLALLYLATVQAVAYGTRHIVETMNANGFGIDTIFACGEGIWNPVFLREHADATGCRIVLPAETEAVLLGAAVLGAVASGDSGTLFEAMGMMSRAGDVIEPAEGAVRRYHDAKYAVFHRMYDDFMTYRTMMDAEA